FVLGLAEQQITVYAVTLKLLGLLNTGITFVTLKGFPSIFPVYTVICCSAKPKTKDSSFTDPSTTENIAFPETAGEYFTDHYLDQVMLSDTSDPNVVFDPAFGHYVSIGTGVGYDSDTKELEFCLGAGYFRQVLDRDKVDVFAGADAKFSLTTQNNDGPNNFTRTTFQVGPEIETRFPIKSEQVALTTNLGGGIGFGGQSFGDQSDNLSLGYLEAQLGLYIQLQNLAIGISAPVFNYQRTNLKTEVGNFANSNFSFALNKANPMEVRVIVPIGRE
ncbi:MAG: hypothetical protein AAFV80_12025, partial [Bacteroidota bacterium]